MKLRPSFKDVQVRLAGAYSIFWLQLSFSDMSATDKLLTIFGLFTIDESEWTVEKAAARLGMPVSTTYRHFKSLSDAGLISAFAAGRYVLGPAIIRLDRQIRLQDPLMRAAVPTMKRLALDSLVPSTLLLCRLYNHQVICVHQEISGRSELTVSYERGRLMPLHRGAASKIILANIPARIVSSYHKQNLADVEAVGLGHDWTTLKRNLRILRNAEVCVTRAELDKGALGIASALFSPDDSVIGSLGLVARAEDCDDGLQAHLAKRIQTAAAEITAELRSIVLGSDHPQDSA